MTSEKKSKPPKKGKLEISLNAVRAHFIARGEFVFSWGASRGYSPSTIHYALTGKRNGPRTKAFLDALAKKMNLSSKNPHYDHL